MKITCPVKAFFYSVMMTALLLISCEDDDIHRDTEKPTITVNSPVDGTSVECGGTLSVNVDFSDNERLKSIAIQSAGMGIDESEALDGIPTYNFTRNFVLDGVAIGPHVLVIAATDIQGNEAVFEVAVNVTEVTAPEGEVFAIGEVAWYGWNPKLAMPMARDSENEGWYEITLFSPGGTDAGVKFIGQPVLTPDNWGLLDNADPAGGMVNSDASEAILMPEKGYHVVRFNPSLLQYEITAVEEATLPAPVGQMHLMGCGFVDYDLCWQLEKAIPMAQDIDNEYQFEIEIGFSDEVDLKLNANQAWDEHDCGFNGHDPPPGNIVFTELSCGDGTPDLKYRDRAGTYLIIMDQYLRRASVVKIE